MTVNIYHGDIVYASAYDKLEIFEQSYLIEERGFVKGIYPVLPEDYKGIAVKDYGRGLIIPAFSDLHIHASQYVQRGIGMDKLLFDWLNDYTFPQEARFANIDYAKAIYDKVVRDFILHGTFHASVFTTIHYDACDYLFRKMAEKGLYGYIGKVNMDMNSPEYLCETTEGSLRETERFVAEHQGYETVKPILTPRFAPTCSEKLMKGLGEISKKYGTGLQTHLVESIAEAKWALELYPDYSCDAEIYERNGMLGNGPSIFAHFIFPTEKDKEIIKRTGSVTVHCPDATANVIAGIMPVAALESDGINIAVGTDVGAAATPAVYRQVSRAVQLSKLKEFFEPEGNSTISFTNAFYMSTKAGGSVFDRVGSLENGYRFNAIIIDGLEDEESALTPQERLERFCYGGDERNIVARYINGRFIDI